MRTGSDARGGWPIRDLFQASNFQVHPAPYGKIKA